LIRGVDGIDVDPEKDSKRGVRSLSDQKGVRELMLDHSP
jgi:hypothetical protein